MDYKEELERLIGKWVKKLKLGSWDWKLEITDELLKDKVKPQSIVHVFDEDGEFVVKFLPQEHLDGNYSLDFLVCHELLHVRLSRLWPAVKTKAYEKEEERTINALTKALIDKEKH